MSIRIPDSPEQFFLEFFPGQHALHRSRFPAGDSPGAAIFEVIGEGIWSIRMRGGSLVVDAGKPADTALQIALSPDDFRAVFVERTNRELAATGRISEEAMGAFRPLFTTEKKLKTIEGIRDTLAFSIDHDGEKRRLFITPGNGERGEPRTTIAVNLKTFLAMQNGKANTTMLFMTGKLKIRGDMGYAMRMQALLA